MSTVASEQSTSSSDINDCHYNITAEASNEKEILMPYDEGHYAFVCSGQTFIARQQETADGTRIACWEDSDWGQDALVEENTICNDVSIEIGSVTSNCTADVPNCCDECGVCDDDPANDGDTCRTYRYGEIHIDLCPNDPNITLVWTGFHNIRELVDDAFVGDVLDLNGADDNGFISNGLDRTLSAASLSEWDSVRTWGCTLHDSGRITATCNQSPPTCGDAKTPTHYQQLGCCEC